MNVWSGLDQTLTCARRCLKVVLIKELKGLKSYKNTHESSACRCAVFTASNLDDHMSIGMLAILCLDPFVPCKVYTTHTSSLIQSD